MLKAKTFFSATLHCHKQFVINDKFFCNFFWPTARGPQGPRTQGKVQICIFAAERHKLCRKGNSLFAAIAGFHSFTGFLYWREWWRQYKICYIWWQECLLDSWLLSSCEHRETSVKGNRHARRVYATHWSSRGFGCWPFVWLSRCGSEGGGWCCRLVHAGGRLKISTRGLWPHNYPSSHSDGLSLRSHLADEGNNTLRNSSHRSQTL